jgi:hypothetical protein
MASLGVPVKLLHESLGHVVTVELKTGQLYRGKLAEGMYTFHMRLGFGRANLLVLCGLASISRG